MSTIAKGCFVRSVAGRDAGKIFLVLDEDGLRVTGVDGQLRRMEHPKTKNIKHVVFYAENRNERLLGKILEGIRLEDAEVRKAIRQASEEVL